MKINEKIITKNFTQGRNNNKITSIVMHTYGGAGTSLYNWFQNNNVGVSAHYAVMKDGTIEHYVEDYNTAHHAGDWNVNVQSIGIEHQDDGKSSDTTRTDALYESSAKLVASLCKNNNIPCKRGRSGILLHKEVTSTGCPGGLDVDRIIRRANEILNPPKAPTPPKESEVDKLKAQIKKLEGEKKEIEKSLKSEIEILKQEVESLRKALKKAETSNATRKGIEIVLNAIQRAIKDIKSKK